MHSHRFVSFSLSVLLIVAFPSLADAQKVSPPLVQPPVTTPPPQKEPHIVLPVPEEVGKGNHAMVAPSLKGTAPAIPGSMSLVVGGSTSDSTPCPQQKSSCKTKSKRPKDQGAPSNTKAAAVPQLNRYLDQVFWYSPITILYGADFRVDNSAPETITAREVYYIAEPLPAALDKKAAPKPVPQFIAYCIYQYDKNATALDSCPAQPLAAKFIDVQYQIELKRASDLDEPMPQYTTYGQWVRNGILHQSIRFSAREVWVLLKYSDSDLRWRLLRRARFLQDSFGKEGETSRMTTFYMPKDTFIALDVAQKEISPDRDIIDYPRVFAGEFWLTRVNPNAWSIVRWPIQKLTAVGISNLFFQWVAVAIPPFATVLAFIIKLFKRSPSNLDLLGVIRRLRQPRSTQQEDIPVDPGGTPSP